MVLFLGIFDPVPSYPLPSRTLQLTYLLAGQREETSENAWRQRSQKKRKQITKTKTNRGKQRVESTSELSEIVISNWDRAWSRSLRSLHSVLEKGECHTVTQTIVTLSQFHALSFSSDVICACRPRTSLSERIIELGIHCLFQFKYSSQ